MPNPNRYYSDDIPGRIEWWRNIEQHGADVLPQLNFPPAQVSAILLDAAWAIYLYETLREEIAEFQKVAIGWANSITSGTPNLPIPEVPEVPVWPAVPESAVPTGIEQRRAAWVEQAKAAPAYDKAVHGALLRIEAPQTPWDPAAYQAKISGFKNMVPKIVEGRAEKAYGRIDGVFIEGRKVGSIAWVPLAKPNRARFSFSVPVPDGGAEAWQFRARAFINDEPVGLFSDILEVTVQG